MNTARMQEWMDEGQKIIDEAKGAEVRKAIEPERNADGDSIEDMRKVVGKFGQDGVEYNVNPSLYPAWCVPCATFPRSEDGKTAHNYRVRAKHAEEENLAVVANT